MYTVGTDIEEVSRFTKLLKIENAISWKKFFTKNEIKYCQSKTLPAMHFASRFAGKEAVVKAITALGFTLKVHEVEIIHNSQNVPLIKLPKKFQDQCSVQISLSHTPKIALAFVIASKKI